MNNMTDEEWIESRSKEIAAEILSDDGYKTGIWANSLVFDISDIVGEVICMDDEKIANYEKAQLNIITDKPNAVAEFKTIMEKFALQLAKKLAADELAAKENDCDN